MDSKLEEYRAKKRRQVVIDNVKATLTSMIPSMPNAIKSNHVTTTTDEVSVFFVVIHSIKDYSQISLYYHSRAKKQKNQPRSPAKNLIRQQHMKVMMLTTKMMK